MARACLFRSVLLAMAFSMLSPVLLPSAIFAEAVSKEDVLKKYEKVLSDAEELNLYDQDIYSILPKVRLASKALLAENYEQADRLLEDVSLHSEVLRAKKPVRVERNLRLEWLEIYFEIIQKLAFLGLLAFLLFQSARVRKHLQGAKAGWPYQAAWVFITVFLGILFSLNDAARYGESAWAFFDIQVVLAVIAGLAGGWACGLVTGFILALFRWLLSPGMLVYPAVVVWAGLCGSAGSFFLKNFRATAKISWMSGLAAGLLHALLIYLPAASWMKPKALLFSITFITLIEGAGVYLFFMMLESLLRKEDQRKTENDLLKTRLLFLQAQMNPHFVFNALNTISAVCSRENASAANRLVIRLADFLRRGLQQHEEKVTLREEMAYIEAYLELEAARYGDRLRVERDIRISEAAWDAQIPLLVLQPLVENAVRHGAGALPQGGTVKIVLQEKDHQILAEISDNGPGLTDSQWKQILSGRTHSREGAGVGLRNIHERLTRIYGSGCGLKFQGALGRGAVIGLSLPIKGHKRQTVIKKQGA